MKKIIKFCIVSLLLQGCTALSLVPETMLGSAEKTFKGKYHVNFKEDGIERSLEDLEKAILKNKLKEGKANDNYSRQEMKKIGMYFRVFSNIGVKIGDVVGLHEYYYVTLSCDKNSTIKQIELLIECKTTKRKPCKERVEKMYERIITEYNNI